MIVDQAVKMQMLPEPDIEQKKNCFDSTDSHSEPDTVLSDLAVEQQIQAACVKSEAL